MNLFLKRKRKRRKMRKIKRIFIHCSATPEGRDVRTEDIRRWHLKRGWKDIGYHYVIELDGTVRKGRDNNTIGAGVVGYNKDAIHICYVGGTDKDMNPKDTMTEVQDTVMVNLLKHLKDTYPDATIHGHNEFAAKACPSFDVQEKYGFLNN